ncbi:MAG: QueT transporter family protein [Bacilli bacterium]|jgi:uncharacterized membrane protein
MSKLSARALIKIATVSAIYIALTLVLGDFSYGAIQFRISEILLLLCFYEKKYAYSLVLGCAIANCFSSLGLIDVLVGTLATLLTVIFITRSKNLLVASLWGPIFNLIIGLELHFVLQLPLFITLLQVFIGEAVVLLLIGLPLFTFLEKNQNFINLIMISEERKDEDAGI